MHPLSFYQLRQANELRANNDIDKIDEWSPTDWACALSGEVGEACNLIKKRRRGEAIPTVDIAKELADAVTYIDLLACKLGIDLGAAVADKFNEISMRRGSQVVLTTPYQHAMIAHNYGVSE